MKRLNFPFTAIIGQDRLRKALILNVIDPSIGGVLLTGHQGTGKSTAVRSLKDILPDIEAIEGCPFSCDPNSNIDLLCDSCKSKVLSNKEYNKAKKAISLVDLPLGVTEDMVCGSLDLEKVLKEGTKTLHPGLLAKANRGILYIDEINLLQDHIVDILLDAAASGVNIIEREGVSISHPAKFVLVGSMNPEEGELRPQINDRLGLEVSVDAPQDPKIRAEITQRVMQFGINPNEFISRYNQKQDDLKQKIINAKKILNSIEIPISIYEFVSRLVVELGVQSQRADITFIRCSRANAAFRGSKIVEMIDLDSAIDLVFEHRLRVLRDDIEPEEIKDKIKDIYGKIKEAYEDPNIYKPNRNQEGPMKGSSDPQTEFKRQPFDPDKLKDLPEAKDEKIPDLEDSEKYETQQSSGIKVSDLSRINKFTMDDLKPVADLFSKRITNILTMLKNSKKQTDFMGRGNRTKITSSQKGRYISYKYPVGFPKNIAFDASVKKSIIRNLCVSNRPLESLDYGFDNYSASGINSSMNGASSFSHTSNLNYSPSVASQNGCLLNLPIRMDKSDIMEKVFEFKAPLTIYFILDASGSMNRYINQMTDVIRAVHTEGYKKKDKTSVIVFKGKKAHVLQRPTTNISRIMAKLGSIEGSSYTPLASALIKCENMIKAERMKNKDVIPAIIICSDLGANISMKYPELKAQTREDWDLIADELKAISKRFNRKKIKMAVIKPKKSWPTRYLGLEPFTVEKIEHDLKRYGNTEIFEIDGYNPRETLINLKKIL